ncbi:MAG: ParA family protein [Candidatus Tectimicrobiota bacterium]
MIVTLAQSKGGVGKSTAAIHIAAYFQTLAPTLLVDSDHVRVCLAWSRRGKLPFTVVDENQQAKAMQEKRYEHIVIDTPGSIDEQGLRELANGCHLMVIPAVPEAPATDGLLYTISRLQGKADNFRVLLTRVKHNRPQEAVELRAVLVGMGIKVFVTEIPELVAFEKAAAQGVPVYEVDDRRAMRAWETFEALGEEIRHG